MSLAAAVLLLLPVVLAYRPGIPPQKFPEYQCIFHRFNIGGKEYSWDLASLAANPGSEYVAWKDGCLQGNPNAGDPSLCPTYPANSYQDIIFNVCGTVSKAIAPVVCVANAADDSTCYQKPVVPHSHGVAVQFLEDRINENGANYVPPYDCIDYDTCDSATNFDPTNGVQCGVPANFAVDKPSGTLLYNYVQPPPSSPSPAPAPSPNPQYPNAPSYNPLRSADCAANSWKGDYCKTKTTPCTGQAEVLAYYDGTAPNFSLTDETNPNGGINLTYAGALSYDTTWMNSVTDGNGNTFTGDSDRCSDLDPSTGTNILRYLNIFIACDKNAKTLVVDKYTERGQCKYYIEARAAAACGVVGDPFVDCSGGKCYFGKDMAGLFFGTVLLIVPFCYVVWKYCDYRGWLEPVKRFIPDVSPYLPDWLSGRGGVYGGGSYKFVSSASSGATATTSGAAISSSAYGST